MKRLEGEGGQMTVELCIVFPVVIVIAVMAVNALLFFSDCAAFDRIGRNVVRVLAASPSTEDDASILAAKIASAVAAETGMEDVACTPSVADGSIVCFTLTCSFEPTLFGMGIRSSIWGVPLPKLEHSCALSVDVHSPKGQVMLLE